MRKKINLPAIPGFRQIGLKNGKPMLSKKFENKIAGSLNELSMVKGNLLGAQKNIRTIYITSCYNAEGKTTTAIALAYGLAVIGNSKVLLVDVNYRSPKLHKMFGTDIEPGFTDLLDLDVSYDTLLKPTAHNNLTLMTYGSEAPGKSGFADLFHLNPLSGIGRDFDFIVCDGNSTIGSSESILISEFFDGVIITIESERTQYDVVETAVRRIRDVGGVVLGAVMNKRKFYIPEVFYGKR